MPSSTDHGNQNLTLVEKVQTRRDELALALAEERSDRANIEAALARIGPMLTGDLENLPDMVSRNLIRWLEAAKYLGVNTQAPAVEVDTEAPMIEVKTGTQAVEFDVEPRSGNPIEVDRGDGSPTRRAPSRPTPSRSSC